MASITKLKNGRKCIQFVSKNGKRKSVRLGKISMRDAITVKGKIEHLVVASIQKTAIEISVAEWVNSLDSVMREKLENVGLISDLGSSVLLESFIDGYISIRSDVTNGTVLMYKKARKDLIEFFGAGKPIRDITEGDAEDWRGWLVSRKLAENTIRRRSGMAKQFFNYAIKKKILGENPFSVIPSTVRDNPAKFHFIPREDAEKILEKCPDLRWKLIFSLCRYGGFRCPSEIYALTWENVHWDIERITVLSPKTQHHEGKESRTIPLFPELKPLLEQAWDGAEVGATHIIPDRQVNLRTRMMKIIRRAGLNVWPKLFQNLRSTRETELAEEYPIQVVCAWMGNSRSVAQRHYLQVTDHHFEKATKSAAEALHYPVQTMHNKSKQGVESQPENEQR